MRDAEFEREMQAWLDAMERNTTRPCEAAEETMFTEEVLDDLFSYHAPKKGQPERYEAIRAAARTFAKTLVAHTMPGPDQSAAIRELRLCVMTANASIAIEK